MQRQSLPRRKEYWNGTDEYDIRQDRQKLQPCPALVRDMPCWMAITAATDYKIGEVYFKPAVSMYKANDPWSQHGSRMLSCSGVKRQGQTQELLAIFKAYSTADGECGEALYIHRIETENTRSWRLTRLHWQFNGRNNTDQGIEYDPETNEFKRYHMKQPFQFGKGRQEIFYKRCAIPFTGN